MLVLLVFAIPLQVFSHYFLIITKLSGLDSKLWDQVQTSEWSHSHRAVVPQLVISGGIQIVWILSIPEYPLAALIFGPCSCEANLQCSHCTLGRKELTHSCLEVYWQMSSGLAQLLNIILQLSINSQNIWRRFVWWVLIDITTSNIFPKCSDF